MNFLEMKADLNPKDYEWYRGVSGSWHHWHKKVLGGDIMLHVQGEQEGGYWGRIILGTDPHEDKVIYSTWPDEGLHVPFKTPENCAETIDNAWKVLVIGEPSLL